MAKKILIDSGYRAGELLALYAILRSPRFEAAGVCAAAGCTDASITAGALRRVCAAASGAAVFTGADALAKNLDIGRAVYSPQEQALAQRYALQGERAASLLPEAPLVQRPAHSAAELYLNTLRAARQPVDILILGPATAFAAALTADPAVAACAGRVIIAAGGETASDVTASAEYNAWCDPEALQRILSLGLDPLFVLLDAVDGQTPSLLSAFEGTPFEKTDVSQDPASLKALAAVCAAADERFAADAAPAHCTVGMQDFSQGQTIFDPRFYTAPKNCRVLRRFDAARAAEILRGCLRAEGES